MGRRKIEQLPRVVGPCQCGCGQTLIKKYADYTPRFIHNHFRNTEGWMKAHGYRTLRKKIFRSFVRKQLSLARRRQLDTELFVEMENQRNTSPAYCLVRSNHKSSINIIPDGNFLKWFREWNQKTKAKTLSR